MKNACFHGGESFEFIGNDFSNLKNKGKLIRADMTDAWFDPAPEVAKILKNNLSWLAKSTPPMYSEGLIKTISKVRGIPEENILAGAGSSDLIYLFFLKYCKSNSVILDPMYGEYAHIISNVLKKKVRRANLGKTDGFRANINYVAGKASKKSIVVIVNPNNPTGQYLRKSEVIKLLDGLPKGSVLVVDEAYIDYLGKKESVETLVPKRNNLVVLKSMSKIYALSGARVGYMVANKSIISELKAYCPPWAVSAMGQVAAITALKNEGYYAKKIRETHRLRKEFCRKLNSVPHLKLYPSVANFVLIELAGTAETAKSICEKLKKRNIYVRNCNSQSTRFRNKFIRIAVRDKRSNGKIYSALKQILAK